ncbi:MAG: hypothetical protein E4G90_07155 [Gemmatimonadales bacterium]|nr:MAG: hypothetical protein E4G90_07155 [Gemmatimonadales bacterium]
MIAPKEASQSLVILLLGQPAHKQSAPGRRSEAACWRKSQVERMSGKDARRLAGAMFTHLVTIRLMCALGVAESKAQVAIELSYGADRNDASAQSERDGWMN